MLPQSLEAATIRMTRSGSVAREVFGDDFVEHFGGTREHEVALWNSAVTNWEGSSPMVVLALDAGSLIGPLIQWSDTWNLRNILLRPSLTDIISILYSTTSGMRARSRPCY